MWLYPVPIGIEPVLGGGACNRELPRILIPRTRVNKDGQELEVRSTTATTAAKAKR
jgi:hypothetical protein